jgi:hypothetical protein
MCVVYFFTYSAYALLKKLQIVSKKISGSIRHLDAYDSVMSMIIYSTFNHGKQKRKENKRPNVSSITYYL